MMGILLILDYIGAFAPIILTISSLLLLLPKIQYFIVFVIGLSLNHIINTILKLYFKAPRPLNDNKKLEIGLENGQRNSMDKFGMPSGHAQNCAFMLVYITMALKNIFITQIYMTITFISLCQRYKYNNHTFLQLFFGVIVGITLGYFTYSMGKAYITDGK